MAATIGIFAFIDAVSIRPLAYRDPALLIGVFERTSSFTFRRDAAVDPAEALRAELSSARQSGTLVALNHAHVVVESYECARLVPGNSARNLLRRETIALHGLEGSSHIISNSHHCASTNGVETHIPRAVEFNIA